MLCQRNGFNGIMIYLAGKDENNKTIYLERACNLWLKFGKMISTSQVWLAIMDSIPGSYDEKKPNEYQTQDCDIIKRNDISKNTSGRAMNDLTKLL